MKRYELTRKKLDRVVGMLVYASPEAYAPGVFHRKAPDTFSVKEVYLTGEEADPAICVSDPPECSRKRTPIYVLCKAGVSTHEAVEAIRSSIPYVAALGYAGLKDAEASTCQFLYVKCSGEYRLPPAIEGRGFSACFVGRYGWLRRGDLLGNKFSVVLEGAVEKLRNVALATTYPNFFGYQRFGTRRPVTHLIGKALVEGRCWDAVELIAGAPTQAESTKAKEARQAFMEGRYAEAARTYPRSLSLERRIASALANGYSCDEVVEHVIRRWEKAMFVEALQSYLFNLALSRAVIEYGSLEGVARRCDVLPLPSPLIKASDDCSKISKEVFDEEVKHFLDTYRGLWRRAVRPVYFIPEELSVDYLAKDRAIMRFFLGPSTYASVMIREIVRDMLIFR